eukprot:UN17801
MNGRTDSSFAVPLSCLLPTVCNICFTIKVSTYPVGMVETLNMQIVYCLSNRLVV